MSAKRNFVIYIDTAASCEICERLRELRPYGPNAELICYECALKDPPAMERGMRRCLAGEGTA